MTREATDAPPDIERRDLLGWLAFALVGLGVTVLAVRHGARLGTQSAPFLGSYRWHWGPATGLAPAVAALVLTFRQVFEKLRWVAVLAVAYVAGLAWALALALVDGAAGLTRPFDSPDHYLVDIADVGDHPLAYLRDFAANSAAHAPATRGHPPGPVLLLWALDRVGVQGLTLGVLLTALGTLTVPLVLMAVREVCGETPARRYAPVLILAPYAVWVAVSVDALVGLLGAAMVATGAWASNQRRRGWAAAGGALAAGALLGVGALFSYAVPWLGLSVVCLYFARRRPFLNVATGVGALVPLVVAQAAGFNWVDGLWVARADHEARVEPHRGALVWSVVSLVALVLAAGPALYASVRKMRNTPGWPFLVGAGVAVAFSVLAGFARGGVEHAWLPFFPWLTVAVTAPERPGGPPVPMPLLLVAGGVLVAVVVEAVLATPW